MPRFYSKLVRRLRLLKPHREMSAPELAVPVIVLLDNVNLGDGPNHPSAPAVLPAVLEDPAAAAEAVPMKAESESDDDGKAEGTIQFTVPDVRQLCEHVGISSQPVYVRNLPWRIMVMKSGCRDRSSAHKLHYHSSGLGFFLWCDVDPELDSWNCQARADLQVISWKTEAVTETPVVRHVTHRFSREETDWGFRQFLTMEELCDPDKGYTNPSDYSVCLQIRFDADAPKGISDVDLRRQKERFQDIVKDMDFSRENSLSGFEAMYELWKKQKLCDMTIVVDNQHILVHRIVLASRCPYFKAMITGDLSESQQSEVVLNGMEGWAVAELIDFIYTGKIVINAQNVKALLSVADFLLLDDVVKGCCSFLTRSLNASNWSHIRDFAVAYSLPGLLKATDQYILAHFETVMITRQFLELSADTVLQFTSNDKLVICNEEIVYKASVAWLSYKMDVTMEREPYVTQFLANVRFCLLSAEFLAETVSHDRLVLGNEMGLQLVEDAQKYLLLPVAERPEESPQSRLRK